MGKVYSAELASQGSYTGTLLYLVPPGFKTVVRDILCFHNASGGSAQIVWVGNITNQDLWWATWTSSQTGFAEWQGRQVFEPGQQFEIVASDSGSPVHGVSFKVSGYLLELP